MNSIYQRDEFKANASARRIVLQLGSQYSYAPSTMARSRSKSKHINFAHLLAIGLLLLLVRAIVDGALGVS